MRAHQIAAAVAVLALAGLAGCGERTITITVPDNLGTAPTADSTTAPQAAPQYVCTAMKLAAAGEWGSAESHWITDETQTTDLKATFAFLQLGEDAGAIALDQYSHLPLALDVATYDNDLAGDSAYTVGC
jgi:hypothetical protein